MEEQHSLIYINGKYTINNSSLNETITFQNDILQREFPNLSANNSVKEIYYKLGSTNNKIVYKDGEEKKLTWDEPKYNELIMKRQYLVVAVHEKLLKEKQLNAEKTAPKYSTVDFFSTEITLKEREERILDYENKTGTKVTDDMLIKALDTIKKSLLAESDWSQLPDVQSTFTEEEKEEWLTYRATLRELDKSSTPRKVEVPLAPNAK